MDVLYFLKLLRPATHQKSQTRVDCYVNARPENAEPYDDSEEEEGEEEEEDSFFELELTVPPDFDYPKSINGDRCKSPIKLADKAEPKFQHQSPPPTTEPLFSKRKILPIEPVSPKPHQSPISLLKSGPRFRVLMFKKSKSMPVQKTGEGQGKGSNQGEEKRFVTVKVKLDEIGGGGSNDNGGSKLGRNNSLRKQILDDPSPEDSSRRFPKEIVQKYLKLITPLYVKVAKRECDRVKFSGELSSPSTTPTSSPAPTSSPKKEKQGSFPAGIRDVCKHLRKSKSASSGTGVPPPASVQRRDDSLLLQNDGIQSAILHCKRSFNSSRDSSLLSRFASDRMMDSPRVSSDEF